MKKVGLGIIIGIIIGSGAVYAATSLYNSTEVDYTPTDTSWNVSNVGAALDDLKASSGNALANLKNTAIAKAVGADGNTLTSVINKLGDITNNGKVTQSLNTSTKSYTIPKGYHDGTGSVSLTTEEKTVTASRSAQTVTPTSGKVLSKVTVNKYPDATGTYTAKSRGSALDMGTTNNYRYVNTNSVPNSNSETYNVTSNGKKDMGATNNYRYVNVNVSSDVKHAVTVKARALRNQSSTEADPLTVYVEISVDGTLKSSNEVTHHLGGDDKRYIWSGYTQIDTTI